MFVVSLYVVVLVLLNVNINVVWAQNYPNCFKVNVDCFSGSFSCGGTVYIGAADSCYCCINGATLPPFPSPVPIISRKPVKSSSFSSSSSSSGSCFAGTETVQLVSGDVKSIETVKMGDEILVSSLDGKKFSYSPVIAIPHGRNSESTIFTTLNIQSGRQLKLTNNHLLLGGTCGNALKLVQADKLKANDCVRTTKGEEIVTATSTAPGRGIYTVVTKLDALLVVNGVIASSFASNHLVANSFYNIHRILYNLTPSLVKSNFAMSTIEAFGDLVFIIFKIFYLLSILYLLDFYNKIIIL